ncbi:MAG: 5-methyltetrahydropteroyltriglutamate--homocysteine S-methyltransferase [Gammaproteobacteria bacterium]|nr:5-methyltetrahydropteroyltriglutamate--homocysteine S-methyltransferase [Gammaproteobacteria bacterium]
MNKKLYTHNLGFPRIGVKRELKRALESFWAEKTSETQLLETARAIRKENWRHQRAAGIDLIPSNDFSLYDQMLDTCALLGAVPERFRWHDKHVDLATYFTMARGGQGNDGERGGGPTVALEMTKWFDTNYHYLVPEFQTGQTFQLSCTKPFDEFAEALELGIRTMPVLIGPLTFLMLGKVREDKDDVFDRLALLPQVLQVYAEILHRLHAQGAEWVQLDEPVLCLDLTPQQRAAFDTSYRQLREAGPNLKLLLATYFGDLRDNLTTACQLPVNGIHFDAVRAPHELDHLLAALPPTMMLSLGVVDGRNVWRNDFDHSLSLIQKAASAIGGDKLIMSPSCSLLHSPLGLKYETQLDADIKSWLAFAEEKLSEVACLARLINYDGNTPELTENRTAVTRRRQSTRIHDPAVKQRAGAVSPGDLQRQSSFLTRQAKQQTRFNLPLYPTTTIGSFPQTKEVRAARARFKKAELSSADYERFLEQQIAECVGWQDEVGLDVLVHGEFERNDMVEYFGEQLVGFAFTQNGWVQSYGSRCVKPPIIYGDVRRPHSMTVRWTKYAQSRTRKPMKGMLTGPITILQWSFVRDDQPRRETAKQIALALREEVHDLEAADIGIIQIDEPALREGLPLRQADWEEYLSWAVDAFRLAASGVRDNTLIHTHMCYCEFDDILTSIAALDADVISIETSRSNMELLDTFVRFHYPNAIGPGVWDIHSPRVPSADEMLGLVRAAAKVIPAERLWVNPDCGLKTRQWAEIRPSLENMVRAATLVRTDSDPSGA